MPLPDSLETQSGRKDSPRPARRLLPFVAAALCLLFAWFAWRHYSSFEWVRFAQTFKIIRYNWLLLGLFLSLASFVGRAVRWQVMMLPAPSSFGRVVSATYIGFSAIVIFGRAGEVVRPYLIARREKTEIATQAGVWVLERLYDFVVILLLFGIGVSHARELGTGTGSKLQMVLHIGGWVVMGSALVAWGIFYLMARKPELCRRRLEDATSFLPPEPHAKLLEHLDSFLNGIRPAGNWPTLLKTLALTVIEWGIICGAIACYFRSFPPADAFSILDMAAYLGFTGFGAIVQLPGIGGGMQIASVVVLTELFRMSVEQATGFSLLVWAGTSLVVLPVGVPLALYGGLSLKKLRRIGKEVEI